MPPSTSDLLAEIHAGSKLFSMDISKMLLELRAEHQMIGEAIMTLERIARGQGRRRGRPPKWMQDGPVMRSGSRTLPIAPAALGGTRRKRKPFSKETRQRMAAAQKRRWAARNASA